MDQVITFQLAFLIIPSRCYLKLSFESIFICNGFSQLLFSISYHHIYWDVFIVTLIEVTFVFIFLHLVIQKLFEWLESFSNFLIASSIATMNKVYCQNWKNQYNSLEKTCHKEKYWRIKILVLISEKPEKEFLPRNYNLNLF